MFKTLTQLAATAVLILGLTLILPDRGESTSAMHLHLTRSQPAKDTLLASSPTTIALWFTQKPALRLSRITMTGPDGEVKLGPVTALPTDSLRLSAAIEDTLGSGDYTIAWRTTSADGHPVRGTVPFGVRPE